MQIGDDAGHATNCLPVLGVRVVPNRVGILCCRLVAGDGDPLLQTGQRADDEETPRAMDHGAARTVDGVRGGRPRKSTGRDQRLPSHCVIICDQVSRKNNKLVIRQLF